MNRRTRIFVSSFNPQRRNQLMSGYLTDLRHSWRILRRSPALSATAVTALALGIGFTATMFSIVHGGTRNLPVADAGSIVAVRVTVPARGQESGPNPFVFRRWQQTLSSFADLAAFQTVGVNLSDDRARPERASAAVVTPNALTVVGAPPLIGRPFSTADAEPGAPAVVLVSYALWQERLGGLPSAVGQSLRIDGEPHTVVGVMPDGFGFPIHARLWLPLQLEVTPRPGAGPNLEAFGRLAPGTSVDAATRELQLEMSRLASEEPQALDGRSARAFSFVELETPPEIRRGLYLLLLVVSLVLLIACANVANLLLARAATRARDTAIRTALGASRARLVALHVSESAVLVFLAALAGLGLASLGVRFFAAASAGILDAYWMDFRIDGTVVAFVSLLGFVAALASGLLPALRASRPGVSTLLPQVDGRTGGVRIGRLGRGLVAAQLAGACGLLALTTTLVGAATSLRAVDLEFPAQEILTAQLSVPAALVNDPSGRNRFARDLVEALERQPDINRAAVVSNFPGRGGINDEFAWLDAPAPPGAQPTWVEVVSVTPGFFDLATAPRLRGRPFTWQDDERAPGVAIVNEKFAERFSSDREALGRSLRLGDRTYEIVGVVSSLKMEDVEEPETAGVYVPVLQARPFAVRLMASTAGPPLDSVGSLRRAVESVDADIPVLEIASLHDAVYSEMAILDALATLFFAFGLGAVFLAVIGLYAVLSFRVTSRTRELGVRMALGATRRDAIVLLIRQSAAEVAVGLGFGLALAAGLSRIVASQIERIPVTGLAGLLGIAAIVVAGAALAAWRPARRAFRLEPAAALRVE